MPASVEPVADLAEEPGELAEHQRPVTAGDDVGELLEQRVDLRGRDVVVLGVDQTGVAGSAAAAG